VDNVLDLGSPVNLTFDINNVSTKKVAGLSLDNIIQYYSPTHSNTAAIVETHRIAKVPDDDGKFGWTDPFESQPSTRYELYSGDYFNSDPLSALNSPFHSTYRANHSDHKFYFDFFLPYPKAIDQFTDQFIEKYNLPSKTDEISSDGLYAITGREGIPQKFDYIGPRDNDPEEYPPGEIDRSDPADLNLPPESIKQLELQFTPIRLPSITIAINDINLRLVQELAYRYENQLVFTVYGQKSLTENIEVRDIGLEAIGTVAGEKRVSGRQFDVVSRASTRKLQEQMRRNVAELLAGLKEENCIISEDTTLSVLPAANGTCVIEDPVNNSVFAYYQGDSDKNLILDNGGSGIEHFERRSESVYQRQYCL